MIIQITLASIIAICFLVGSLSFEVCVMALNTWFEKLKERGINHLTDSNWFDYTQLETLCEDCKKNIRSGQLLWMFVNVELFRKMYFEKEWRY